MAKVRRTRPKEFIPIQITLETMEEAIILLAHLNQPLGHAEEYVKKYVRDGVEVYKRAVKADVGYKLFCDLDTELNQQGYMKEE